jgi:hypothetical protein
MKILNVILLQILLSVFSYAAEENKNVDCLTLDDENSIICKYIHERVAHDKPIIFQWIDPNGEISRTRDMILPAHHGSIYDYRYISGRMVGTWTFKVIDNKNIYETTFDIK